MQEKKKLQIDSLGRILFKQSWPFFVEIGDEVSLHVYHKRVIVIEKADKQSLQFIKRVDSNRRICLPITQLAYTGMEPGSQVAVQFLKDRVLIAKEPEFLLEYAIEQDGFPRDLGCYRKVDFQERLSLPSALSIFSSRARYFEYELCDEELVLSFHEKTETKKVGQTRITLKLKIEGTRFISFYLLDHHSLGIRSIVVP